MALQLISPAPQADATIAADSEDPRPGSSDDVFAPAEFDLRMAMDFGTNERFWQRRITELDLSDTMILGTQSGQVRSGTREKPIYDGFDAVISGISKRPVAVLKLSNIGLSCAGMERVSRVIGTGNTTLTTLDVSRNNIWHKGFATLTKALLHDTVLQHLDCSRNAARDVGALKFAELLKRNKKLRTLSLADNFIFDEGGIALAKALLKNSHLSSLDLSRNRLTLVSNYAFDKVLLKNTTIESLKLEGNDVRSNGQGLVAHAVEEEEEVRQRILRTNQASNSLRKTLHKIRKKEKEITKQYVVDACAQGATRGLSHEELEHLHRMETALSNRYQERKQQVESLRQDIEELETNMEAKQKQMKLSLESKEHIDQLRVEVDKKTEDLDKTNLEHLRLIERLRKRKSEALDASLELDQKVAAAEREASLAKNRYDEAEKVWISLRRKAVDAQIDIDTAYAEIHKLDKMNESRQAELLQQQMEHEALKEKLQLSRQKRENAQTKLNVLARRQSDAEEFLQEALDIQTDATTSMKQLKCDSVVVEGEMEQNHHAVDDSVVKFLEQKVREQLNAIESLKGEKEELREQAKASEERVKEANTEIAKLKSVISKLESQRESQIEEVSVEEYDLSQDTTPKKKLPDIDQLSSLPCPETTRQVVRPPRRPKTIVQASSMVETHCEVESPPGVPVMEISVPISPVAPQRNVESVNHAPPQEAEIASGEAESKEINETSEPVHGFLDSVVSEEPETTLEVQSIGSGEQTMDLTEDVTEDETALEPVLREDSNIYFQKGQAEEVRGCSVSKDQLNRPLPVPKGKLSSLASSVLLQHRLGMAGPVPEAGNPPAAVGPSPDEQGSNTATDSFITESSESDVEEELKRIEKETVVEIHEDGEEPHDSALYPHERMQFHTKHVQFNLSQTEAQGNITSEVKGSTRDEDVDVSETAKELEDDSSEESFDADKEGSASFLLEASHNAQESENDLEDSHRSGDDIASVEESLQSETIEEKAAVEETVVENTTGGDSQGDQEAQYRLRLEIGQVFGMKRQSALRWSYPRYVWVSPDLKRLLWNKGECKSTKNESLPSWTFDEAVTHHKSKSKWKSITKIMRNDPSCTVTLVNSGGRKENVLLRCSTAVEAEMWRNTFSWWIKYTRKEHRRAEPIPKQMNNVIPLESLAQGDLERIRDATASVVREDIENPQSTYKTMRLRVCDNLGMNLEGEQWVKWFVDEINSNINFIDDEEAKSEELSVLSEEDGLDV